jgi:hypothetical protein
MAMAQEVVLRNLRHLKRSNIWATEIDENLRDVSTYKFLILGPDRSIRANLVRNSHSFTMESKSWIQKN